MPDHPDCKEYLGYLDKEMTIMGILSAVPLAAAGGVLNLVLGEKKEVANGIWINGHWAIITGSILCVVSATLFYKQRSLLAWFYGQICLAPLANGGLRECVLLEDVDSWSSWVWYSLAFDVLAAAFLEYGGALVSYFYLPVNPFWLWVLRSAPFAALVPVGALQWYVLTHYSQNDSPWRDFWNCAVRRPVPHKGVFVRIQSSKLHGVGVFAILPIPKGTYMFIPDDDALVSVKEKDLIGLPNELRVLYEDFCPKNEGRYDCPISFNLLTAAWYLNDSPHPNVASDNTYRFYALKDIEPGDELTIDYATFSKDNPPSWRGPTDPLI